LGFAHLLWDPVAQRLFCPCRPANAGQSGVRRRTIRRASADRPSCVELRCFCLCRALSLSSVVRRTVRRVVSHDVWFVLLSAFVVRRFSADHPSFSGGPSGVSRLEIFSVGVLSAFVVRRVLPRLVLRLFAWALLRGLSWVCS